MFVKNTDVSFSVLCELSKSMGETEFSGTAKKRKKKLFHRWIENSVTRKTDRHHKACRVIRYSF